jgi:hypothetical protein
MRTIKSRLRRLEIGRERTAFVIVSEGKSNEEAWKHHLEQHPEDEDANIKIFFHYKQD